MSAVKPWLRAAVQWPLARVGLRLQRIKPAASADVESGYDDEAEARVQIGIVRDHTMASEACLITLWQQVKYLEQNAIPGDYVECGVWKGGAVGLMALGNLRYASTRRRLHLFDSFRDICEPDAAVDGAKAIRQAMEWSKDGAAQGRLRPLDGFYDRFGGAGSKAACADLIEGRIGYDPAQVRYHEGWFQDTFPAQAPSIGEIALLRLDADWYEATRLCLSHFYDKVVEGGVVIIDDYGTYDGCRRAVDEFFEGRGRPLLHHISRHSRYIVK